MHQAHDVLANSGLAAREADFGHALRNEEAGEADYFGGREEISGGGEGDTGGWHAVGAAEIAALGDGDTEVSVLTVVGVRQKGGEGSGGFGEFGRAEGEGLWWGRRMGRMGLVGWLIIVKRRLCLGNCFCYRDASYMLSRLEGYNLVGYG